MIDASKINELKQYSSQNFAATKVQGVEEKYKQSEGNKNFY